MSGRVVRRAWTALLLALLLAPPSAGWADVGEVPEPGGLVTPGDKTDAIRMKSESVLFSVRPNNGTFDPAWAEFYAHVTAEFVMENLSARIVSMNLFFPFHSSLDLLTYQDLPDLNLLQARNVHVRVGDEEAEVRYAELPLSAGRKVVAAVFAVEFPPAATTTIRVEYDVRAVHEPKSSLVSFEYLMETGSHWAGTIGSGEVAFEFWKPLRGRGDLAAFNGFFDARAGNLVWQFTDLEPDASHNIKVTFDPARLGGTAAPLSPPLWGEACGYNAPYEVDEHTLLLLHLDGSYDGAQGERGEASGLTFEPGRFGQGAMFDGSDLLTFAAAGNLERSQGAIEFWLQPAWDGGDGGSYVFFEVGQGWSNRMQVVKDGANNLRLMLWDGSAETGLSYGVADWRAGEWHHIAATWQANEIALYVDGKEVARNDAARMPTALGDTIWIGSDRGSVQAHAVIDELRISDVPRVGTGPECGPALMALDQIVTTPRDTPADIILAASGGEGKPLVFTVVKEPSNGCLEGTAPDLVYHPGRGFEGHDAFSFRVSDGEHEAEATVRLVVGLPDGPGGACDGPNLLRNGDFEAGFAWPGVGQGWGWFHSELGAVYVFMDDGWAPAVYEGAHSQLLGIGTFGVAPAANRFAGIHQTVAGLAPGAVYELSVAGMMREEADHPDEDPYRYQVQWAYSSQGHQDWTRVAGWQELPWSAFSLRTEPGGFSTYAARIVAPDRPLTLFLRAWKKWATPGRELDVNLDAIVLRRCGP